MMIHIIAYRQLDEKRSPSAGKTVLEIAASISFKQDKRFRGVDRQLCMQYNDCKFIHSKPLKRR